MRLGNGKLAAVVLAGAVLMILNIPAPAMAQSTPLSVQIPFDFHAGNNTMPAGKYIVDRVGEAIRISDSNGHAAFVIATAVPNPAAKSDNQLVFNCYGDDRYLSEVRWMGYSAARGLTKTVKETELAKVFSGRNVLTAGLTK